MAPAHDIRKISGRDVESSRGDVFYKSLLETVEDASIDLEEFARSMVGQEELHQIELKKMPRGPR